MAVPALRTAGAWIRLGCAQRVDPPTASPIPHATLSGPLGTLLATLRAGSTRVWQSKPDHRGGWRLGESRSQEFSIGADQRDI